MNNVSFEAMLFAREVHKDQKRKYTGNPYVDHLAEVAGIVSTAIPYSLGDFIDYILATAWLHDCMEDQGVSYITLLDRFGPTVADGVKMLSDMETGNRANRKEASRKRLSDAEFWVQDIKCADIISNTSSIVQHDPKFAVLYLEEKRLLLDVMTRGDEGLLRMAKEQII